MKYTIKIVLALYFIIQIPITSMAYAEVPSEFFNCPKVKFELAELKYYSKDELISAYCICKGLIVPTEKHVAKIKDNLITMYSFEEYQEALIPVRMTDDNKSRITRILRVDHKFEISGKDCKQ